MNVNKALYTFIKIGISFIVTLILIYGAVRLCSLSYDYGYRLFTEPAMEEEPGRDVLFQVKEGMSGRDVSRLMEEKGLVRDANLFYVQIVLSDYKDAIKPGVYTLNTSMEPKELMIAISPEPSEAEETEETEEPRSEEPEVFAPEDMEPEEEIDDISGENL